MNRADVEEIFDEYRMIAIILRAGFHAEGIEFFTPNSLSQQLAYMNRPKGHVVEAHMHRPVPRNVRYTQETLFVRRGKVRINFYREDRSFLSTRELSTGDVILLVSGGHDFKMLEDTEMIEVKQGPYAGNEDKIRFEAHRDDPR